LVRALVARGERVAVLTRDVERSAARLGSEVRALAWNPGEDESWWGALDGAGGVVHLAGEQAVGVRWTREVKRRIRSSRVDSTRALVAAMGRAARKPAAFLLASAVGYYGARDGALELDETAPAGEDFLAEVCAANEAAAREAEALGVRVVLLRFGIVLGRGGGALAEMVRPFKLFAGGPIGDGAQIVSWIHVDDAVDAVLRALDDPSLAGPVNVTAPNPVSNAELSRAIGHALGRPSWLRVPRLALEARFGEGATPLVTGQRAIPKRLCDLGFEFLHRDVASALAEVLG
jgi:uncharacterized protein